MKRQSLFLASLLFAVTLLTPAKASAMSWDWLPKILRFESFTPVHKELVPQDFECKKRNSWGDCVVYGSPKEF